MADPDAVNDSMADSVAGQRAAASLGRLIQFRTVSDWLPGPAVPDQTEHPDQSGRPERSEFERQIEALRELYPLVHERLVQERVGRGGLLYR